MKVMNKEEALRNAKKHCFFIGVNDSGAELCKPNACGMLVGGLEQLPDIESLIRKLRELEMDTVKINGVEVAWDFYKSNHFIDVLEVKAVTKPDFDLPGYAFAVHGSASEFTGDNESGFGLYYDKSRRLCEMAECIETPFGEFHIVAGDAAKRYFERYRCVEDFAKKKRRSAGNLLFGHS